MEVRSQFRERHCGLYSHAVVDHMQIRLVEIDDPSAVGISNVRVADVPLARHSPVEDLGSGRHIADLQRDPLTDAAQRFSQPIASDASADWIKIDDELVHFPASYIYRH